MGAVNISLANGQLGQSGQTEDGVMGLVVTGATSEDLVDALGTPYRITSYAALTALGITTEDNAFACKQVREFYAEAGTGAVLYLMLVPDTLTVADIADETVAAGAKKLLDFAAGKIKVLGIMTNDSLPEVTTGINDDVHVAMTKMQALANSYAGLQMPFRGVIGGTSYQGDPGDLTGISTGTKNRVMVVIGDSASGTGAAVGLLLGRLGATSVQEKLSKVANGAIALTDAYLGTDAVPDVGADLDAIAEKGYVTFKQYPHASGYYWSSDNMAVVASDDYSFMARGRIIDKAHVLAYKQFLQEVDDEVPVDAETGKLDAAYCAHLQQQIANTINNQMTANKEIVSVTAFVDPEQNVLSTNEVTVNLGIVPVGYSTVINVNLGFQNPAL